MELAVIIPLSSRLVEDKRNQISAIRNGLSWQFSNGAGIVDDLSSSKLLSAILGAGQNHITISGNFTLEFVHCLFNYLWIIRSVQLQPG